MNSIAAEQLLSDNAMALHPIADEALPDSRLFARVDEQAGTVEFRAYIGFSVVQAITIEQLFSANHGSEEFFLSTAEMTARQLRDNVLKLGIQAASEQLARDAIYGFRRWS